MMYLDGFIGDVLMLVVVMVDIVFLEDDVICMFFNGVVEE